MKADGGPQTDVLQGLWLERNILSDQVLSKDFSTEMRGRHHMKLGVVKVPASVEAPAPSLSLPLPNSVTHYPPSPDSPSKAVCKDEQPCLDSQLWICISSYPRPPVWTPSVPFLPFADTLSTTTHLLKSNCSPFFGFVSLLCLSLCKSKKEVFFNIVINLRMWGRGTSRSLTTDSSTGLVK